jgi:hypothetical protein
LLPYTAHGGIGLNIEVIALQETWDIKYPDQLIIHGYQKIVFKNRLGMRGGGVGSMLKMV